MWPLVAAINEQLEQERIHAEQGGQHQHVAIAVLNIGRMVRFHLRDDIFDAQRSHVDTAALAPVGRLAAEYTLVDNVFVPPLAPSVLREREEARMHRIDGRATDWAAVKQASWSPSGSVLAR